MIGFIVNPVSGNGRGKKTWKKIARALAKENRPYEVLFTEKPGDASVYAQRMASAQTFRKIVALGGDGTVNEVITGLFQANSMLPFGHIPAGSGNDFARGHLIPKDQMEALKLLFADTKPLSIDILSLRQGIAASSIGAGFDGKVAQETNRAAYKKWLNRIGLGFLAYFLTVVRVLFAYKPVSVELVVDGETFVYPDVWLVATANIPYIGGGMKICPTARPDDGQAEICIVNRIGKLEFLRVFPLVYSGKHAMHPAVHFHRGSHILIRSETPLAVHKDGEFAGETPLEIRVLANALPVIKPAANADSERP
ncbi:MAG TPA: diacylglycerol kinase family protein [Bacilli bacterium]